MSDIEPVSLTQQILAGMVAGDSTLPEPVTVTQQLLVLLYGVLKGDESSIADLIERVTELEENPLDPETVHTIVTELIEEHPEWVTTVQPDSITSKELGEGVPFLKEDGYIYVKGDYE